MARKPRELTADEISQANRLAMVGLNNDQLAGYFGVSPATWDRIMERQAEVGEAIEKGRASGIGKVAASLFQNATQKNNVAAQIFFLKTRARWREIHPETPDGTAQPIVLTYQRKASKDDGDGGEPA